MKWEVIGDRESLLKELNLRILFFCFFSLLTFVHSYLICLFVRPQFVCVCVCMCVLISFEVSFWHNQYHFDMR
jgi:hypothetical protein